MERYDAGLLNDFGGGNTEWWQDYIRAELERADEFYRRQYEALRAENVRLKTALAGRTYFHSDAAVEKERDDLAREVGVIEQERIEMNRAFFERAEIAESERDDLAARVGELVKALKKTPCMCSIVEQGSKCFRCKVLARPTHSAASRLRDDIYEECAGIAESRAGGLTREDVEGCGNAGDYEEAASNDEARAIADAIRARKSKP